MQSLKLPAVSVHADAQFLRRMMIKLGVSQEQAKAATAAGVYKPTSRIAQVGGQPVVQIDETFEGAVDGR